MVVGGGAVADVFAAAVELSAGTTGIGVSAIKRRWGKGGGVQKYAENKADSSLKHRLPSPK